MESRVAEFYRANPRMVSSPFGGIDGINGALLASVFESLAFTFGGCRVLDVGCGRGFVRDVVRAAGGVYEGVDLVPNGTDFPLVLGDAQSLPFADGSFDRVMCLDAFEHIPEPARAAVEFRRVLKPGGAFFLSAPNYANVAGIVKTVYEGLGWYEKNTWAPFGRWQPQEWESPLTTRRVRRLFERAGFDTIRRVPYANEVGLGVFPWMDHRRTPEAIQFRLQRFFKAVGPAIAHVWPDASLHSFWRMDCPAEPAHAR